MWIRLYVNLLKTSVVIASFHVAFCSNFAMNRMAGCGSGQTWWITWPVVLGSWLCFQYPQYSGHVQCIATCWYSVLQERETTRQILHRPTFRRVMFLRKYKENTFFLWVQGFDRRCVCYGNPNSTNCVSYEKLLFFITDVSKHNR
jgi:hypothetical protein